ncbi:protein translocase subunit yidC [Sphaerotilus hippei]|uniref:Membrane protein insertase YidC n=1 Tax=Sphaerotilus hippei TaxID=744406 RepID=A0A318H6V2_9BURK|nr:membrane protein insertase YidC [Sphaerotilus hippei]PXW99471.1 protein translocase subunit yidC [Sphaerotilus hippei]
MTDVRRALLWGVFSVSLVMLWDGWNKHNGQPSMFSPATAVTAAASAPGSSVPAPVALGAAAAAGTVPGTAAAAAPASELVQVSTDTLTLRFDTLGATLVHAELLKHHESADAKHPIVLLDRSASRVYLAQTGLIPAQPGTELPTHQTPMTVSPGERTLAAGQDELKIRFESAEVGGAKLVKTFTLRRGQYLIGVEQEVVNTGAAPLKAQAYLQLVRDGNPLPDASSFYSTFTGPAIYTEAGKFQKEEFKAIEKRSAGAKPDHETTADNGWAAMVQHYFATAWLLPEKATREFFTRKVDTNLYSVGMIVPLEEIAPGASRKLSSQLFVGPQEEKRLEAMAPGLELVKDYGFVTILAKPMFWTLDKLHSFIGNWGWSIIALVVLLKIAFYWLNANAYKSMAKMKAVGPKVQEMRERLKDDPQKMQQEMMRIYREEKVNPLGGCLPIFVQMPFFIALYWVLLSSVEMRGAPWLGWITDLSAKDPFFILPLLMTATSLLQVWLNPTPPDPMQAKMMWIMPLAFSVMFFFFPAGLVLYWFVNNLLSIAQQWMINRQLGVA